ncbi:MAG TPA: hypothetical protein VJN70_19160 [Gemmatimonadaceae bacterium]|nr:hypothetical protein [Gemmatimonadaceae bacterium]
MTGSSLAPASELNQQTSRETPVWKSVVHFFWGPDARLQRLDTSIADFDRDFTSRATRADADAVGRNVRGFLMDAHSAWKADQLDKGWALLHNAQRTAISSYIDEDVSALVPALRGECDEKLRGWRRSSASELLGKPGTQPSRQNVQQAMKLLHEDSDNTYHKLELVREQLRLLVPILVVALLVFAAAVTFGQYRIGELQATDMLLIMLLGALGGALSAVRSTAGSRDRKIPERLFASPITFLRPLIGAVAAIGVALLLQGGVGKLGDGSKIALLSAAFVAGFTERWFLSLIETATASKTEKEKT